MGLRVTITGNFFRLYDDAADTDLIRKAKGEIAFFRKGDEFVFLNNSPFGTNDNSQQDNVIGKNAELFVQGDPLSQQTVFDVADLLKEDGSAWADANELDDFLSGNIGFFLVKLYESDILFVSNVLVGPVAAITLLPANDDRIAVAISNNGNQDIVVRFKRAAVDNNVDGITVKAMETLILRDIEYKGEISAIRLTAAGGATSPTNSTEW